MSIDLQPTLQNDLVLLQPLQADDFEALYAVASDKLIWEQHPNPNRYQREVFRTYFDGAMVSKGALLIKNAEGEVIGCSRYYDYDTANNSVLIGYTFFGRAYWGTTYNRTVKLLMLAHIFQSVTTVKFHIGAKNIRSQRAIERLGAVKVATREVAYFGEPLQTNYEYEITKELFEKVISNF